MHLPKVSNDWRAEQGEVIGGVVGAQVGDGSGKTAAIINWHTGWRHDQTAYGGING